MSENDPRLNDATTRLPRHNSPGEHAPLPGSPSGGAPAGGAPSYGGSPAYGNAPSAPPYGTPAAPSYGTPSGGPAYGTPSGGQGYGNPQGGQGYGNPQGGPSYGPSYGTPPPPPPGSARPYGSPAHSAPGPVRPRVLWIVLAWLIAVVCFVVGVAGFAGGLFKTINDAAPTQTFKSGGSVAAALDPKGKPVLYASASGPTNVTCSALDAAGQKATLTQPTSSQTVTADGRKWELLFDIGVPAAGTYNIRCKAEEGKDALFGVGKSLTASPGALAGGVASLILIPLAGFVLAVVTTIVVLVRRSRERKRRAAASASYGGAWPQGTPPGA
ncbi:hypothetical protein ACOZ38_34475 [Sphaerisporangium viridialbum]|uniref:hypothetical protein n=1 Tax=Sphaerisporangium viridialbum TaxID=46189 RepID=UPI003C75193C